MKRKIAFLFVLMFLPLLSAGAQDHIGEWQLVSILDKDGIEQPSGKYRITLEFTPKAVRGRACNSFSGGYSIDRGKLKVSKMITTLKACQDANAERTLKKILGSRPSISAENGILIIRDKSSGTSIKFKSLKIPSIADLDGKWQLDSMFLGDASIPLGGNPVTLNIENGKIGGNGGCNSYGGKISGKLTTIKFSEIFSTKIYCEGIPENQYFEALEGSSRWELRDSQLILRSHKTKYVLVFNRSDK